MNPFDFAVRLRECEKLEQFTSSSLAAFWNLSTAHFLSATDDSPIQFFGLGDESDLARHLRGAQFFTKTGPKSKPRIIRGHPRILPTSDQTESRSAILTEKLLFDSLASGYGDAIVEPKLVGQTIRVYSQGGDLFCATDVSFDGGNPLVGAGIENSRALGIDYGHQAARLVTERYGKIDRLARLGYVGVFVLTLPETASGQTVDGADLVLVDVIDPDHQFVERNEKERVAEDYGLTVVPLTTRLSVPETADSPLSFVRACRGLARQAHQEALPGYIVKIRADDSSDQAFVRVESMTERDRPREFSSSDLTAVVDEITGQYGDTIWSDPLTSEAMMLDFLGSHHASAVRQVHAYIDAWQAAKKSVGLG